jgi:hypothetical protein
MAKEQFDVMPLGKDPEYTYSMDCGQTQLQQCGRCGRQREREVYEHFRSHNAIYL